MQHSVTVVRKEREHHLISSPVSTLYARSTRHFDRTMKRVLHSFICMCQRSCLQHRTWEEMKVQARGSIHCKIRLKMTNITHNFVIEFGIQQNVLFSCSFNTSVVSDALHEPYLLFTNSLFILILSDSHRGCLIWVKFVEIPKQKFESQLKVIPQK